VPLLNSGMNGISHTIMLNVLFTNMQCTLQKCQWDTRVSKVSEYQFGMKHITCGYKLIGTMLHILFENGALENFVSEDCYILLMLCDEMKF